MDIKQINEFKVNDFLTLKLKNKRTNIYVNGKLFNQCKFLLLSIPSKRVGEFDNIDSIDEAAEQLDLSMERGNIYKYHLTPETEFWGHCSNLQAWYENDYNTRILHRNLAFPLLEALFKAGDPLAKKVFKEEIAMRFENGYASVVSYLANQNYLKFLSREELNTILENPVFIKNITEDIDNFKNIPKWLRLKIRKFIPRRLREVIDLDYSGLYDATYKVVLLGDPNVGKANLTRSSLNNLFNSDMRMTIGVDFEVKSLEIDDLRIKLLFWDFGAIERFKSLLPKYIRGADGVLFVYDITNYSSLSHIDDWMLVINQGIKEKEFSMIVVGVISDIEKERQIPLEEGINIAKSIGADGFFECIPRTGENVEELFDILARLILSKSGLIV